MTKFYRLYTNEKIPQVEGQFENTEIGAVALKNGAQPLFYAKTQKPDFEKPG